MGQSFIPAGYAPHLSLYETQSAISLIKRVFQDALSRELNLRRVSAPLFVEPSSGLNDDLNGVERPVGFDIPCAGAQAQVVHSLAKWKRMALYRYDIHPGKGIYTDMNAIRRDEELDNLHSVYVDQWDWEKVITPEARTPFTLHQAVTSIVSCIYDTQLTVRGKYPQLCDTPLLNRHVTFITAQELEDLYPDLTPKQRLKAEKWLAIIHECINSDLSNEVWCEQNNVNIKSYYYYLAKLRKMAIEQIPYKKRNNVLPLVPKSNDIVEIQAPQSTPVCISSSVMTICQGNTKIEINSNCPEWMIRELLNKYVR